LCILQLKDCVHLCKTRFLCLWCIVLLLWYSHKWWDNICNMIIVSHVNLTIYVSLYLIWFMAKNGLCISLYFFGTLYFLNKNICCLFLWHKIMGPCCFFNSPKQAMICKQLVLTHILGKQLLPFYFCACLYWWTLNHYHTGISSIETKDGFKFTFDFFVGYVLNGGELGAKNVMIVMDMRKKNLISKMVKSS
jgi:hypothetical protein